MPKEGFFKRFCLGTHMEIISQGRVESEAGGGRGSGAVWVEGYRQGVQT